ncbi:hypothetical protein SARI_00685 [Salmonella enterica subsp. arizonae serovar 62:z4,z23:-]|uniref:Uncharacterized protein n=1 Tax=Salmonella arizonae (strain ATCC BAA-731 / CDC346-86 / RSK2980) TaxID=41514 RepID=A9MK50_SALAR|nr:hypothetical protein SARI_00685 [Salmonella enterica subsp. arizonae serovar 62:z4,z23:-]
MRSDVFHKRLLLNPLYGSLRTYNNGLTGVKRNGLCDKAMDQDVNGSAANNQPSE